MTQVAVDTCAYPCETLDVHTRLLRCGLEIDESRAFWACGASAACESPELVALAFEQYWFGAKSLARVKELIVNLRARFAAFPQAWTVLSRWSAMRPETRTAICHWHLQLSDPLYRRFSGDYLLSRHGCLYADVSRTLATRWLSEQVGERWALSTRSQYASKLLSAAQAAGLVVGRRDSRPVVFPRISDEALTYLLYLLRDASFDGTLRDNPYLRSVGLGIDGDVLDDRLRALSALDYRRVDDVIEFGWAYPDLQHWADAELLAAGAPL